MYRVLEKGTHVVNGKQKYVVLYEGLLQVYANPRAKKPDMQLRVSGASECVAVTHQGQAALSLEESGDEGAVQIYITPDMKDERDAWYKTLRAIIKARTTKVQKNSLMEGYMFKAGGNSKNFAKVRSCVACP